MEKKEFSALAFERIGGCWEAGRILLGAEPYYSVTHRGKIGDVDAWHTLSGPDPDQVLLVASQYVGPEA